MSIIRVIRCPDTLFNGTLHIYITNGKSMLLVFLSVVKGF